MYLLGATGGYDYQSRLWQILRAGDLQIYDLSFDEVARCDTLMHKYRDVPMDFADASIVAIADVLRACKVFTIDSGFHIYRLSDGNVLDLFPA